MKKKFTEDELMNKEYDDIAFKRLKQDIRAKNQEIQKCKAELELMEQEERLMFRERKAKAYGNKVLLGGY